jgi:hypothetical protein
MYTVWCVYGILGRQITNYTGHIRCEYTVLAGPKTNAHTCTHTTTNAPRKATTQKNMVQRNLQENHLQLAL